MGWIAEKYTHSCPVPKYDCPTPGFAVETGDLWACDTCGTIWMVSGRSRMQMEPGSVETWRLSFRAQRYPFDEGL